jgi:hypothetical protein
MSPMMFRLFTVIAIALAALSMQAGADAPAPLAGGAHFAAR